MGRRWHYIDVPRLEKDGVSTPINLIVDQALLYFSLLEVIHIDMNAICWGVQLSSAPSDKRLSCWLTFSEHARHRHLHHGARTK